MFEWDANNLRKIRAHGITRDEAEQALLHDPILVHEQDAGSEIRFLYCGETSGGRLLALVVVELEAVVRVVTAYPLDASQKREYLLKRAVGE